MLSAVTVRLRPLRKVADRYGGIAWWHWGHLLDWALCFALLAFAGFLSSGVFSPYHRKMQQDDPYDLPKLHDTVPSWALAPIVLAPIFIVLVAQFPTPSLHDIHHGLLAWLESVSLNFLATQAAKLLAGRYRPSWDNDRTADGRQSFPSGHSSISFAAMVLITLYAAGKTGLYSKRGGGGQLWKFLLLSAPIIVASLVAISRTRDYRHHFSDVLAGAILGSAMACCAYLLNYPPPWSSTAAKPKSRHAPQPAVVIASTGSIIEDASIAASSSGARSGGTFRLDAV